MTSAQVKRNWCNLVDEKFKGEAEYYGAIMEKLKRLKFAHDKPKHGKHNTGKKDDNHCIYCYARKHFPNLLKLFLIENHAKEMPTRKKRTRLEHHSPKQDQLRLDTANQLDLF